MGGQREAAQRTWEAEKKLRRRVEALERRLEERGVELQAAEGQTAKARDLLARQDERKTTIKSRFAISPDVSVRTVISLNLLRQTASVCP